MIKRANFDDKSYQLLSSNLHQFIIKVRSIHYRTSLVSSAKQMESFVKDCQEVSQSLWVCLTSCWVLLDFMVSFRAKLTTKACKTRYQVMQNRTPDSAHQVACSCLLKSGQPQGYINRWTVTKKISNLNKWEKMSFPWSLAFYCYKHNNYCSFISHFQTGTTGIPCSIPSSSYVISRHFQSSCALAST